MSENKQEEDQLQKMLRENPNLFLNEAGKVKCTLTGHEMPSKISAIQQYLNGKKYKRIMLKDKFNFSDYEPLIVPSSKKGHENHLFCILTLRHINKTAPHVLRHVSGRRFLKAKARWEECQKSGTKFVPTPFLSKPHRYTGDMEDAEGDDDEEASDGETTRDEDLTDLYPVKYFEELSIGEEAGDAQVETQVKKKKSRKRSKPGTKPMKSSKPAAKRKKENLIVSV